MGNITKKEVGTGGEYVTINTETISTLRVKEDNWLSPDVIEVTLTSGKSIDVYASNLDSLKSEIKDANIKQ